MKEYIVQDQVAKRKKNKQERQKWKQGKEESYGKYTNIFWD